MSSSLFVCCLRSEEGRELRRTHQKNVAYLRNNLLQAGVRPEPEFVNVYVQSPNL
jgi:hypothetical protein